MIAVGIAGQSGRLGAVSSGDSRRWADFLAICGVGISVPWGKPYDQLREVAVEDLHNWRG